MRPNANDRTTPLDSPKRTLVKSLLWTVIGLITMALVGFAFTGSLTTGGGMAAINATIGLAMYALYERLWSAIRWGRDA